MTPAFTLPEIHAALARVCPSDAARVIRELHAARIDARQQDALNRMHAAAKAMASATGPAWLALQDDFTRAMEDSDAAQEEAEGP